MIGGGVLIGLAYQSEAGFRSVGAPYRPGIESVVGPLEREENVPSGRSGDLDSHLVREARLCSIVIPQLVDRDECFGERRDASDVADEHVVAFAIRVGEDVHSTSWD